MGTALVLTREPQRTYRACVVIDGGLIHGSDVALRRGAYNEVWFQATSDRAWSASEVRELRWLDDREAA